MEHKGELAKGEGAVVREREVWRKERRSIKNGGKETKR